MPRLKMQSVFMKNSCDRVGLLSIVALFFNFATACAQQTTPGAVTLSSTFECISVKASFRGDDNANNSATIQFRKTGDMSWLDAYPPIVDRRAGVNIGG